MKNKTSRDLYAYWNEQRGLRLAPSRTDIDPAAIRGVLADTFMVTREAGAAPEFRLAGTRVCDLFGRELKGETFLSLWDARSHDELRTLLDHLAEEAIGFVAGVTSSTDGGTKVALELLLLPLYRAGATEARSIGTLAPMTENGPLALQSISGLALEGWRLVGPQLQDVMVPRYADLPGAHLTVLPGGRS